MTDEGSPSIDATTLANMRLRVDRCRRLARGCTDLEVAKSLYAMADEGEADIARVMAELRSGDSA